MTDKICISKNGKFAKLFPKPVADKIREIAASYHKLSTVSYGQKSASDIFHVGEGERYEGIFPDGKSVGFETVSANTIGASGLSHKIGSQFQMPEGIYLIRVSYYTKYFMDVYFIGPELLVA